MLTKKMFWAKRHTCENYLLNSLEAYPFLFQHKPANRGNKRRFK
jgi:hypothetical protein